MLGSQGIPTVIARSLAGIAAGLPGLNYITGGGRAPAHTDVVDVVEGSLDVVDHGVPTRGRVCH